MQRWPRAVPAGSGSAPRATPARASYAVGPRRPTPPARGAARLLLAEGRRLPPGLPTSAGALELRRIGALPSPDELDPARPSVVLLDRGLLAASPDARFRAVALARVAALVWAAEPGEAEPPPEAPDQLLTAFVAGDATAKAALAQLRGAFRAAAALAAAHAAREEERARRQELAELARIGAALTIERDLMTLLDLILSQARRMTASDAGSLYLVERHDETGVPRGLRFKLAQNDSLPRLPLAEHVLPVDNSSLAGHAASTGEPLVIADAWALPDDAAYRVNRSFDERFGYRTKSMLVIPMSTHRDEVVGVLQLINRKREPGALLTSAEATEREVLPFDERSVALVRALAAQAAVAIENNLLYESIERLFEGFVTATVTAIEQRDPTTSGHSARVADLTVRLAVATEHAGAGRYRGLRFTREQLRELRYAGLLHDVGKVGVSEEILVKEKKLYPATREAIRGRFAFLVQAAELEFERARARHLLEHGRARYAEVERELERVLRARRLELERYHQAILAACEPTVLPEGTFGQLAQLAELTFPDVDGEERPLLAPGELRQLSVRQGTLDEVERRAIEAHVTYTFRFLRQIPWTRELRSIPDIARAHHEKLDGSGYPRGVRAEDIPVQARMMTIADIYDALTATDRPYKKAVPRDEAVEILQAQAAKGELDDDLLRVFVGARLWESGGA
jgi:HD-GYP domain-containing protein (c-di-GMP phosphodiesterase class II)